MPDMLLMVPSGMDDIRHLTQASAEVEFGHRFEPDMSPFILPEPDELSCLDKEMGRAIRRLQHLDNLGRNLPQRSIVDNDLGKLDGRRLWVRLRCMVRGILAPLRAHRQSPALDHGWARPSGISSLVVGDGEVPGVSSPPRHLCDRRSRPPRCPGHRQPRIGHTSGGSDLYAALVGTSHTPSGHGG